MSSSEKKKRKADELHGHEAMNIRFHSLPALESSTDSPNVFDMEVHNGSDISVHHELNNKEKEQEKDKERIHDNKLTMQVNALNWALKGIAKSGLMFKEKHVATSDESVNDRSSAFAAWIIHTSQTHNQLQKSSLHSNLQSQQQNGLRNLHRAAIAALCMSEILQPACLHSILHSQPDSSVCSSASSSSVSSLLSSSSSSSSSFPAFRVGRRRKDFEYVSSVQLDRQGLLCSVLNSSMQICSVLHEILYQLEILRLNDLLEEWEKLTLHLQHIFIHHAIQIGYTIAHSRLSTRPTPLAATTTLNSSSASVLSSSSATLQQLVDGLSQPVYSAAWKQCVACIFRSLSSSFNDQQNVPAMEEQLQTVTSEAIRRRDSLLLSSSPSMTLTVNNSDWQIFVQARPHALTQRTISSLARLWQNATPSANMHVTTAAGAQVSYTAHRQSSALQSSPHQQRRHAERLHRGASSTLHIPSTPHNSSPSLISVAPPTPTRRSPTTSQTQLSSHGHGGTNPKGSFGTSSALSSDGVQAFFDRAEQDLQVGQIATSTSGLPSSSFVPNLYAPFTALEVIRTLHSTRAQWENMMKSIEQHRRSGSQSAGR